MSGTNTVRICVPVCVRYARDLRPTIERAAEVADIIEVRLDCFEGGQLDTAKAELSAPLAACPRPFVLTLRPAEQGGQGAIDVAERRRFWSEPANHADANFIDLELDLLLTLKNSGLQTEGAPDRRRIICSYHDFKGVPANIDEIYERMKEAPAHVLKIAVQATSITDCIPVFRLLERARREGREMIAIAMGEAGIATRILGPSRGAFLTYGSLDARHATAPGQLSASELRHLYHVHALNERTAITGLVGSPVAHSFSPHMHNAAFAARGVDAVYIPFEVRDVGEFVRRMVRPASREIDWELRGLSVTAPHKSAIAEHLDWVSPSAKEIGAVNTVRIEGDLLYGYNTDASSVLLPLQDLIELRDARVALIGAGGAARAALWSLRETGARSVTVFARSAERAQDVAKVFGAHSAPLDGAHFGDFELVINATPLGTRGRRVDETPATAQQLRGARIAYDLVYNPSETRFLREAREAGCARRVGGLEMLLAQAAEQFRLWTGLEAPTEAMREAAEKQMSDARC